MQPALRRTIDIQSTRLWLARALSAGAFSMLMSWEWSQWPNGTVMLGPLGVIWYNGIDGGSLALVAISLVALFAFWFKPTATTGIVSLLGTVNWLFWGMMAIGIGC